ncbi:RNA helicase family protein [Tasmannia lanceolata]|uniref:RNA helicase family protein n=1 Tax=Tasmannia lanceolata TaxID=3420 RepID=UPI004063208F
MRPYCENREHPVDEAREEYRENQERHVDESLKLLEPEEHGEYLSSKCDENNMYLLPEKKRSKPRGMSQGKVKGAPHLSKSQRRKLKQLQEEKEKRALELKSIRNLEKYKIQDNAYALLRSSGNMGQVETMREKRRRAMQLSKAGLEVPQDEPPFKKKRRQGASSQCDDTLEYDSDRSQSKRDSHNGDLPQPNITRSDDLNSYVPLDNYLKPNCSSGVVADVGLDTTIPTPELAYKDSDTCMLDDQKSFSIASCGYDRGKDTKMQDKEVDGSRVDMLDDQKSSVIASCGYDRGKDSNIQDRDFDVSRVDCENNSLLAGGAMPKPLNGRTIVHVSRPNEVESKRGDLPIVMMEQEIMEAINEHPTVIICGETGCGKTTQVPQFLYEAGFGSSKFSDRKGIIGVTQPRRVAVLATAKRVAFELGLCLGREVGFQVRHDKKIGESCSMKFMTDGILLREVQNDFLLKRYSIIILDEAHERSLNTDILIGMLSRIIHMRQKLYEEQQGKVLSGAKISPELMITPLKLVLMSATIRVEDFVANRKLFHESPPVIEVTTRQFPVTIHFSRRTEIVDYVGQAYKKVLSIHKKLPPGGILVFVTGQREVEYLCRKLRKASQQLAGKANNEVAPVTKMENLEQGPDIKDISEAFEIHGNAPDHQRDRFSSCDEDLDDLGRDMYSSDSGTENEAEIDSDDEDSDLEMPEKTSMVANILSEEGSLASLKAAFKAITGKTPSVNSKESRPSSPSRDGCSQMSLISGRKHGPDGLCSGALYVLPLYAMLPATAQLCVFEEVHKGERLVVVATNVAETSLTIPGIKYVVDTGREKVKNYNYANGMATYEVQWISKASAKQRAGRAGRTGPGHCYCLYSSAVFNNIFSDFSNAEITKIPVDGVVLLMKFMGIDKVANFPFPTPPEATALGEAERCLKALEALDSQGRVTTMGKAMAQFPMSPRHSRMLLTVICIMRKLQGYGRANLVLGYAVAAAAALSFSNPFIMQFDGCQGNKDELDQNDKCDKNESNEVGTDCEKILDPQEKLRQKKLKAMAKVAREKFCNPSSDALTIAFALQLFEHSESQLEFCKDNALHLKTMDEMSKLRKQMLHLIFYQIVIGALHEEFSWPHGNVEDVENAWKVSVGKCPLLLNEEELLGQAICAGWADRVAKRVRAFSESSDRKAGAVRYQACTVNETVYLHRWSSVSRSGSDFLVFNELIHTRRPYMHGVTSVKSDWLVKYVSPLCSFSAPLTDPKPYYEPLNDQVLCWVSPSFGPHLWQLPLHSIPIKNTLLRVSVFAYALLEGNVLPCLKSAKKFLAAPPANILRPEASGQKRVCNLLNKLMSGSRIIDSRAVLRKTWNENPHELHSEILSWFQERFHDHFKEMWVKMHHEVLLEAQELFSKRIKKEKKSKNRQQKV